jgi:hypothetical protein
VGILVRLDAQLRKTELPVHGVGAGQPTNPARARFVVFDLPQLPASFAARRKTQTAVPLVGNRIRGLDIQQYTLRVMKSQEVAHGELKQQVCVAAAPVRWRDTEVV